MRKLSLALAILIALQLFSCGDSAQLSDSGNNQEHDSSAAETAPETLTATVPDGLNLDNKTVTFLYREGSVSEFYVDTATGDIVDDAIYKSFNYTEELLNVQINVEARPGDAVTDRENYNNLIKNAVLSGDSTYDWCDSMIGLMPGMITEGYFTDLLENKYIDLSAKYWLSGLTDNCAPTGKLFFISGDSSLGYLKKAYCLFYNTSLAEKFGCEDIYKLVLDGKWTLDKLREVSVSAASDLNADGEWTLDDTLGFVVHDFTHPRAFLFSTGGKLFSNDDGAWTFTYGSERDHDVAEKLYRLFYESDGSYFFNSSDAFADRLDDYNEITSAFTSGKVLLMTAEFDHAVSKLRNMNDNYGIIPCPKYDESGDYITVSRSTHNAFAMPVTSADPDAAGAVMEVLAAYKFKTVLPAYFEIALKTKYSRDDMSAQMCDIIRDSMKLDFGFVYNNVLGNPIVTVFEKVCAAPEAFSSILASQTESINTLTEEYLEKLADTSVSQ